MFECEYPIRTYKQGDEKEIFRLFKVAFKGRTMDEAIWRWQVGYDKDYASHIVTMWDKDRLIAHVAYTPFPTMFMGKSIISALGWTVIADPEYLGVSAELLTACRIIIKGVDLKYGFPNKNAFKLQTKFLKYHYIGDMCFWTAPPCKTIENKNIRAIIKFTEAHGNLYKELVTKCDYIVQKNAKYLNWRFTNKPNSGYKMFEYRINNKAMGYIVLNEYKETDGKVHGQIIEILAITNEVFSELLRFARGYFKDRNCDLVKLWMSHENYKKVLQDNEFQYGVQPFPITIWDRDLNLENMYITMADSDVF